MLGRRRHIAPAVHGATGHALEHHDLAGAADRQRGEHEVLAHTGDEVEVDGRVLGAGRHAVHIGQRQGALRLVVGAAAGVALEHLGDGALAGGHDHEVVALRPALQVVHAGFVHQQLATQAAEFGHPAGHLHALVDRLRLVVQPVAPAHGFFAGQLGVGHGEGNAFDRRAFGFPEVEPAVAFELQAVVEHALAGQHLAGAQVLGCAVAGDADAVTALEQADAQLQSGLAGADDHDLAHGGVSWWCGEKRGWLSPSAWGWPAQRTPGPWPNNPRRPRSRRR